MLVEDHLGHQGSPGVGHQDHREIRLLSPDDPGELVHRPGGAPDASRPQPAQPPEVPVVLLQARPAVPAVVVGPHVVTGGRERPAHVLVPAGMLADPVGELDDRPGAFRQPAGVRDADAVGVDEGILDAAHPRLRVALLHGSQHRPPGAAPHRRPGRPVRSGTDRSRRTDLSRHSHATTHRGACRKTPGTAHNRWLHDHEDRLAPPTRGTPPRHGHPTRSWRPRPPSGRPTTRRPHHAEGAIRHDARATDTRATDAHLTDIRLTDT
ncbi:hypothetical protein SDC9_156213 [bioreactor metagenome]|uniref:Uncharacterized protein n=1 Tax=bioreactor metagenome TaxID=1076179 RepID=A0A645F3K5_9ZZZZ